MPDITREEHYNKYGRYYNPLEKWMLIIIIVAVMVLKVFNRI